MTCEARELEEAFRHLWYRDTLMGPQLSMHWAASTLETE